MPKPPTSSESVADRVLSDRAESARDEKMDRLFSGEATMPGFIPLAQIRRKNGADGPAK